MTLVFTSEQAISGELSATADTGDTGTLDWPYVDEPTSDTTRTDFFFIRVNSDGSGVDRLLHQMYVGPSGGLRITDAEGPVALSYLPGSGEMELSYPIASGTQVDTFTAPVDQWLRVDVTLTGATLTYTVSKPFTSTVYYELLAAALDPDWPAFCYHSFTLTNVAGFQNWLDAINVEPPEPPSTDCHDCGERWIVESCNIRTGEVQNVLSPLAFDFQTSLNAVGKGSMTFATRDVRVQDIWPDLTLIAISRDTGDPDNPEGMFLGFVESFDASSALEGGTTRIGLVEVTNYLWRRTIQEDYPPEGSPLETFQTYIARDLVGLTTGWIPLSAVAALSEFVRARTWFGYERPVIGEQIQALVDVEDGLDWETTYTRSGGAWSAQIRFADHVGEARGIVLASDREGVEYSLTVDASEHATRVDTIGQGEADETLMATATDTSVYPLFDVTVSFPDQVPPEGTEQQDVLQEYADGLLATFKEPAAVPGMTIAGPDPAPSVLKLGDEVTVQIDYGAVTFNGLARIIDITWNVSADNPDLRQIAFTPITPASQSVLNQVPSDSNCQEC